MMDWWTLDDNGVIFRKSTNQHLYIINVELLRVSAMVMRRSLIGGMSLSLQERSDALKGTSELTFYL